MSELLNDTPIIGSEKTIKEDKRPNIRLFPIYKMFSWDLLFYYAISFLFLTNVKGIAPENIILLDAFYTAFKLLLQIPSTTIIERYGNKKSLVIANSFIAAYVLLIIIAPNFAVIIFGHLLAAIGFVIKGTAESTLLYDSIPSSDKKTQFFSKADGKGSSNYYFLEGVLCIASGFLYTINPYIPVVICLLIRLFSVYLSTKFISHSEPKESESFKIVYKGLKKSIKDLKTAFKFIFKSRRLRALILFYAVFAAYIALANNYRKGLLQDLNISSQYFGIIFGILNILSGISSKKQELFHKTLRNQTLAWLAIPFGFASIIIGLASLSNIPNTLLITIVLLMYGLQYLGKGPLYTLIKRYLGNFSNSSIRPKIYSATDLMDSIFRIIFAILGAKLLGVSNTAFAFVVTGCIFTLIIIFILEYMKKRVGLKPEQYRSQDISFTEVK